MTVRVRSASGAGDTAEAAPGPDPAHTQLVLVVGWACIVTSVCLWVLVTIRVSRANPQSRIPWIGRPPNRSMATNVAQFFAFLTLFSGLTVIGDHGSVWEEWLAFGIALATMAVLVGAILMHNDRVKYGE